MTERGSNVSSCKYKSRTAKILNLATNNPECGGAKINSCKKTLKRNITPTKSVPNSSKEKNYLALYDEGNWEELNSVLSRGLKKMNQQNTKKEPLKNDCNRSKKLYSATITSQEDDNNILTTDDTCLVNVHENPVAATQNGCEHKPEYIEFDFVKKNWCKPTTSENSQIFTVTSSNSNNEAVEPGIINCVNENLNNDNDIVFSSPPGYPKSPLKPTKPKRVRRCDRRNFCLFCNILVLNFRRHLLNNHKNEFVIANYIALLETCKEESKKKRSQIIENLKLQGNHMYNEMLLSTESEQKCANDLIPVKRPPKNKFVKLSQYVTCTICYGLFVRKHYYEHATVCKRKFDETSETNKLQPETTTEPNTDDKFAKTQYLKMYGLPCCKRSNLVSKEMEKNIFPVLRNDEIGTKAMNDTLLVLLVSDFYTSHTEFKDRTQVTRKLRDGARLVQQVNSIDPEVKTFSDLFQPNKINVVMEACKKLCNLDQNDNSKKPVVVGMNGRLSWLIEEGCKRLIDDIICNDSLTQDQKATKKKEVKYFHECIRRRWKYTISTNLEKKRRRTKIMKEVLLPLDEDIKSFVTMLKEMEKSYQEKLELEMPNITVRDYETLCKITICHILTLNRRRPFEATHSEIEFYLKKLNSSEYYSKDVLNTLADEERVTLNELSSYIVPAKGIEAVATILLTKQMEKSIDLIIKCRPIFKMSDSVYLFSRPGLKTPFDGSKVLREMKVLCQNLKKPEHLTATGLRHHVATLGHVKGPEFTSKLSQFMCHTQSVHDKNYVAPMNIIHKGVIGNYLTTLEGTSFNTPEETDVDSNDHRIYTTEPVQEDETHRRFRTVSSDPDYEAEDSTDDKEDEEAIFKNPPKKRMPNMSRQKHRWTEEEKSTVIKHFSNCIKRGENPGLPQSRELIKCSGELLKHRTPHQINTFIDNINKGKLKLPLEFKFLKKSK